jgi:hypothetical protein
MELILTILDELAPQIIPEGLDLARQKTLEDFSHSRRRGSPHRPACARNPRHELDVFLKKRGV